MEIASDDLFRFEAGIEHLLRGPGDDEEEAERNNARASSGAASGLATLDNDDLGLDTEIKVTKKRAPPVKLDENRLLSQAGIPKLRSSARTKLKFKGKLHEFSDVARLLNFYQLWLDDLYPRAKFADGLAIIEKVGHSKRMQVMRKEWIDQSKPGRNNSTYDAYNSSNERDYNSDTAINIAIPDRTISSSTAHASSNIAPRPSSQTTALPSIFGGGSGGGGQRRNADEHDDLFGNDLFVSDGMNIDASGQGADVPEEDDFDALLAEQGTGGTMQSVSRRPQIPKSSFSVEVEEDDLDAILAENGNASTSAPGDHQTSSRMPDDFDDEFHILNELGL